MFKKWDLKKILTSVFLVLVVVGIVVSVLAASIMTRSTDPHIDISPEVISAKSEDISFKDSEGRNLKGWFFPSTSDKLIIFIPGIYENRINTGYLEPMISQELIAKGYNIIMYDNQATGESEGDRVSYGPKEGLGLVAAVDWAAKKGFPQNKIGLIADSMGSAAILEVIKKINDVGPVVLDSSPANMEEAAGNILTTEHPMPRIFLPGVFFFAKILYGVDFKAIVPEERIKETPERHYLFLATKHDTSIPPSHSERLMKAANPASKLIIFPNGAHIETFKGNPELFRKEVYSYLEEEFARAASK